MNTVNNNLEYKNINISEIIPHPKNPNNHTRLNLNEISESIKSVGYIDPIVVRPFGDAYQILAGEGRYLACKQMGQVTIPSVVVTLTDEQALAYMIASNEIPRSSEIDPFKFEDVIKTLNELNPDFQWTSIGLSPQEAGALLNFDIDVINDGDLQVDPHDGIKEKVKPLKLTLEQRAFVDHAVTVYNSLVEEPVTNEAIAVINILADWLAGMTTNEQNQE